MKLAVSDHSHLRALRETDAKTLFALTEANRSRLREWLPWLDHVKTWEDSLAFIRAQADLAEKKEALSLGFFADEQLIGVVSFNQIDLSQSYGKIGYWIDQDSQGKGLMTLAVKTLIDFGFSELNLRKIIIRCATGNALIKVIPKRLGFRFSRMIPKNENLYGRLVDHYEYEMGRPELRD
jgi:ribosomal-protein-serine acetyltransferase